MRFDHCEHYEANQPGGRLGGGLSQKRGVGIEIRVLEAFGGRVVKPSILLIKLMGFQRGTFDIAPPPLYFSGGAVHESAETSILEPISSSTAAKRVGG